MDLIMLIIRLAAFATTFYLMLEFIFVCKVDTRLASLLTFITMILVIIFFIVFKRYELTQCGKCKQSVNKSLFPTAIKL